MKLLLLIGLIYLDLCKSSETTGKTTTGNGKSIFKLTIKNRPYVSAYTATSKEPYLSLASEIQYSMRTMFFGATGNYFVPRLGKARPFSYCIQPTGTPSSSSNVTLTISPPDCSQKIIQIKAILYFNYSLNAGFKREKIKDIWDIAMKHGFIGNLKLIPEQCDLQLKLIVTLKSTLPSMIKNTSAANATDYEALFRKAIRTTSEIGNGLSLIGAVLTILTLRCFRKLRAKKVNLIISILSGTVAACNALNFAVQRAAKYPIGCKIVSISLHFFLLSKMIWMTILALHLYFKLIKVFSTINYLTTARLIKFTVLIGFGIPVLVVGTAVVLDGDKIYKRNANGFCWMDRGYADALFVFPMLAFVGINFVIFLIISIQIRKLSKGHHHIQNKFTLSNVRSLMAFVTALGLAWIFVLLTYIEEPAIMRNCFEALFVICTSLQGFLLYYFYCISKAEIRACYLELFDYRPFSQTPTITGNSTRRTLTVRNSIVGNHQVQNT